MSQSVKCQTHGTRKLSIVCFHLLEPQSSKSSANFNWDYNSEDGYEAACADCASLSEAQFNKIAVEVGQAVCEDCFMSLAAEYGVVASAG